MSNNSKTDTRPRPSYSYLMLGAALFAFIQAFSLLSPILLSLLLILLISLALNPVISRLRAFTGGRKRATGLIAAALVMVIGLTGWAFSGPMKNSIAKLSERLPAYLERLQKPLIKMEQQEVLSEEKLQAEVITEITKASTEGDQAEIKRRTTGPAQANTTKESGSLRSSLSQMIQNVIGRFMAVAFNAAQILVVLVTVFIGVIFTLMNPRPIFGAIFLIVPRAPP